MVSPSVAGEGMGEARARFRGCVWRTAMGDGSEEVPWAPHPGPGPGYPRSRPRGADPRVASSPSPFTRAPRRHGRSPGLACVPSRVRVGAGDSRTSRGARQGASASINRGGRGDLGTPTPQEPLPQPPAVRPELIRILIV